MLEANAREIDAIVDAVRTGYAGPGTTLRFGLDPLASDCGSAETQALRRSIASSMRAAIDHTTPGGMKLRHLLLVAAYPASVSEDDACNTRALDDAARRAKYDAVPPLPRAIEMHAPIELIFRTQGERHG